MTDIFHIYVPKPSEDSSSFMSQILKPFEPFEVPVWLTILGIIFAVAVEGRRLPMPETRDGECLAGELTSLMVECWREESRDRPAFSHIEERVAAMRRRLSSL